MEKRINSEKETVQFYGNIQREFKPWINFAIFFIHFEFEEVKEENIKNKLIWHLLFFKTLRIISEWNIKFLSF